MPDNSLFQVNWNYLGIFLIVLLIIVVIVFLFYDEDQVESVDAMDGKSYQVRSEGNDQNKKQTANYLAEVSQKVDQLIQYMLDNHKPSTEIAQRLEKRWKKCVLRETASKENSVAYTVNKGDEMRLCVKNGAGMENMNTTMFVVLHELGHLMSVTYGHNEEFRKNFSFIVHLASSLGVYKPEDFYNKPVSYCGTVINTTPCGGGTCTFTSVPQHERSKYGIIAAEAFGNTRGFVPTWM